MDFLERVTAEFFHSVCRLYFWSRLWTSFDLIRKMVAFHSFWSEPNRCRNGGEVLFPDFEQLTAILSALEWQRHNGPIRMVTDTAGLEFFEKSGLRGFWNQMVPELDALQGKIDPIAFWAAGKLYALQTMTLPCVMLDTDLIIWENIDERLEADVVAAHPEPLNPGTYPDPSGFRFRDDYVFPKTWNTALPAANTAFLLKRREAGNVLHFDCPTVQLPNCPTAKK